MPTRINLIKLSLATVLLSGCESMDFFSGGSDTEQLKNEVEELYKGVDELENGIVQLRGRYARLKVERDDLANRLSKYETVEIQVKDEPEAPAMNNDMADDSGTADSNNTAVTSSANTTTNSTSRPVARDISGTLSYMMGGRFGVHIASYKTPQSASSGWADLKAKHPNAFRGAQARLAMLNLPNLGGTYYRLKVGPFENGNTAKDACTQLEGIGLYCKVTPFDGDRIE